MSQLTLNCSRSNPLSRISKLKFPSHIRSIHGTNSRANSPRPFKTFFPTQNNDNKWSKPVEKRILNDFLTQSPVTKLSVEERLALIKKTQKSNKWAKPEPVEQPAPITNPPTGTWSREVTQPSYGRNERNPPDFNLGKWKTNTNNDIEKRILHNVFEAEGAKSVNVEKPSTKLGQTLDKIMETQIPKPKDQIAKPANNVKSVKDKKPVFSEEKRREVIAKANNKEEFVGHEDLEQILEKKKKILTETVKTQREVFIPEAINVANLSKVIGVKYEQLVDKMKELEMENTRHDYVLTSEEASLVVMEYDMNPIVDSVASLDLYPRPKPEDMSIYSIRPPIVTIMGHVDHGKTTLLDSLRKASVAASEAGGITQHIGAFSVTLPSKKKITFIDTPGHAAFSAMRARGANATDIVVLVVAADDGVMPQTIEAINHATAAGVPMIVAINKCDKPNINTQKIKEELLRYNVQLEEFGGDTQAVPISGLTGMGLAELEENISTLAEVLDLRAEVDGSSEGVVLESQVEKGLGNVATVLVHRGTLKSGSVVVAGTSWGKIRRMIDDKGKVIKVAGPGTPVRIIGWKDLPNAGDEMLEARDESLAKTVTENRRIRATRELEMKDIEVIRERRQKEREEQLEERLKEKKFKRDVWEYYHGLRTTYPVMVRSESKDSSGEEEKNPIIELPVIVKGDVSGTVEAVVASLGGLPSNEVRLKVVHSNVGAITEADVDMASACEGVVLGFNVKGDKQTMAKAKLKKVEVKSHTVIYKLLEDAKTMLARLLPPEYTTKVAGEAKIQQVFQINVKGRLTSPVAGCRVTNGSILKNNKIRVIRQDETVFEGLLTSLKQVKMDVAEAKKGIECGMSFDGFESFQEGDIIQSIETIQVPRQL
ncbi:translation initiation factor IF-2 [Basidiobolus ranarum]|uniref:Translation initiation factor IF-2, mitochondrial n=1 Tax=Basidiobolus ranarum TaxID=34480 RepID=A0ABR2VZ08_9FUNG